MADFRVGAGETWATWANVVWGGAGVNPGDRLIVTSLLDISSTIQPGSSGTDAESPITILCEDNAGFRFTQAGAFLNLNKNHILWEALYAEHTDPGTTVIFTSGVTGNVLDTPEIVGGRRAVTLGAANGASHVDWQIRNPLIRGAAEDGIYLLAHNTNTVAIENFLLQGGTIRDVGDSPLHIRSEDSAVNTTVAGFVVRNAHLHTYGQFAIRIVKGENAAAWADGLIESVLYENGGGGSSGGGITYNGFSPSAGTWGKNAIRRCTGRNLNGPAGGVNCFFSSYLDIHDNEVDGVTTDTVDGNGVLVDHGSDHVRVRSNRLKGAVGNEAENNSGCALMLLDSTNVEFLGNVGDGCRIGIWIGANTPDGQSSLWAGNTLRGITTTAVHVTASSGDPSANQVYGNVFEGSGAQVNNDSTDTLNEDRNIFTGFGASVGHTDGANSVTTDPQLDANHRPQNRALWGSVPRLDAARRDYDDNIRERMTTPGAFAMERKARPVSFGAKARR